MKYKICKIVDGNNNVTYQIKKKYGWVVSSVNKFENIIAINKTKGIIFTTGITL